MSGARCLMKLVFKPCKWVVHRLRYMYKHTCSCFEVTALKPFCLFICLSGFMPYIIKIISLHMEGNVRYAVDDGMLTFPVNLIYEIGGRHKQRKNAIVYIIYTYIIRLNNKY